MKSLSVFVGTAACNAHCAHCAGAPHREFAPQQDDFVNMDLIYDTMISCYEKGAYNLSISGSGEPTLSPLAVSKVMLLVATLRKFGMIYNPVNLYSNGIIIGTDVEFCRKYLPVWKADGLTTVYITIHSTNAQENASIYGVPSYPDLDLIVDRLHQAGLKMRANLILNVNAIGTYERFQDTITVLHSISVDSVAAWCLRDRNDEVDAKLAPAPEVLDKMEAYANLESQRRFPYLVKLYREENRGYQEGDKLTLFPNGTLSNNWCK